MQDFATIHRPPEMMDQPDLGQTVSIPQRVSVEELEPKAKESRVVVGCGFCQQKMVDLMGSNEDWTANILGIRHTPWKCGKILPYWPSNRGLIPHCSAPLHHVQPASPLFWLQSAVAWRNSRILVHQAVGIWRSTWTITSPEYVESVPYTSYVWYVLICIMCKICIQFFGGGTDQIIHPQKERRLCSMTNVALPGPRKNEWCGAKLIYCPFLPETHIALV